MKRRRPFRGQLESVARFVGGLLEASEGASWENVEAPWGPLGGLREILGGILGAYWGFLGVSRPSLGGWLPGLLRLPYLGPLLGPSGGILGRLASRSPKTREREHLTKTYGKSFMSTSGGLLGAPLGVGQSLRLHGPC